MNVFAKTWLALKTLTTSWASYLQCATGIDADTGSTMEAQWTYTRSTMEAIESTLAWDSGNLTKKDNCEGGRSVSWPLQTQHLSASLRAELIAAMGCHPMLRPPLNPIHCPGVTCLRTLFSVSVMFSLKIPKQVSIVIATSNRGRDRVMRAHLLLSTTGFYIGVQFLYLHQDCKNSWLELQLPLHVC
jgi:hypothetical protein